MRTDDTSPLLVGEQLYPMLLRARNLRSSNPNPNLSMLNLPGRDIVLARRTAGFLVSAMVPTHPSPVSSAHAIVSFENFGKFNRFGTFEPTLSKFVGMRHTVSLPPDSDPCSEEFVLRISPVDTMMCQVALGFNMMKMVKNVREGRSGLSIGPVYQLKVTFVLFGNPSPPSGVVQKDSLTTKFLLRLWDGHSLPKSLATVPRNGFILWADYWMGRGGGVLELEEIKVLPESFLAVADVVRGKMKKKGVFDVFCDGVGKRFEKRMEMKKCENCDEEEEEEEEGEEGEEGEEEGKPSTCRDVLWLSLERERLRSGGSYDRFESYHAGSRTYWPIPVSSPIVNVSRGGTTLLSKNICDCVIFPTAAASNCSSVQSIFSDTAGILPPVEFEDGILSQYSTGEFLKELREDLLEPLQGWRFARGAFLGEGGFGVVRSCRPYQRNGRPVFSYQGIETLAEKSSRSGLDPGIVERMLLKEAVVWRNCWFAEFRNPFLGCTEFVKGRTSLLFERYRGDCSDWIRTPPECLLDPQVRLSVLLRIAKQLELIHDSGYAHCDLKPENLFVDENSVHIFDFGLAVDWEFCRNGILPCGTPGYMPPTFDYDPKKIDIFSLGITFWELWTRRRAFEQERRDLDKIELLRQADVVEFQLRIQDRRPSLEECDAMPERVKSLLRRCWSEEPSRRPASSVVVSELHACLSHAEALPSFLDGREMDRKGARVLSGVLRNDAGRKEEALRDYDEAIELDPTDPIAYFNRGKTLCGLGREDEALRDYDKAIELYPRYGPSSLLGDVLDERTPLLPRSIGTNQVLRKEKVGQVPMGLGHQELQLQSRKRQTLRRGLEEKVGRIPGFVAAVMVAGACCCICLCFPAVLVTLGLNPKWERPTYLREFNDAALRWWPVRMDLREYEVLVNVEGIGRLRANPVSREVDSSYLKTLPNDNPPLNTSWSPYHFEASVDLSGVKGSSISLQLSFVRNEETFTSQSFQVFLGENDEICTDDETCYPSGQWVVSACASVDFESLKPQLKPQSCIENSSPYWWEFEEDHSGVSNLLIVVRDPNDPFLYAAKKKGLGRSFKVYLIEMLVAPGLALIGCLVCVLAFICCILSVICAKAAGCCCFYRIRKKHIKLTDLA